MWAIPSKSFILYHKFSEIDPISQHIYISSNSSFASAIPEGHIEGINPLNEQSAHSLSNMASTDDERCRFRGTERNVHNNLVVSNQF
jgi:hypothetical protein